MAKKICGDCGLQIKGKFAKYDEKRDVYLHDNDPVGVGVHGCGTSYKMKLDEEVNLKRVQI